MQRISLCKGAFHDLSSTTLHRGHADPQFSRQHPDFDHPGAHEHSLLPKRGIAHAFLMGCEVIGFGADILRQFGMSRCLRAQRSD
jgi:hypothetical protein